MFSNKQEPEPTETPPAATGLTIHPNPTAGEFTITLPPSRLRAETRHFGVQARSPSQITIYDIFGRLIHQSAIHNSQSEIINISQHSKGVYFVKAVQGGSVYTEKLVVQ